MKHNAAVKISLTSCKGLDDSSLYKTSVPRCHGAKALHVSVDQCLTAETFRGGCTNILVLVRVNKFPLAIVWLSCSNSQPVELFKR